MAAAYAALRSLDFMIDQIQHSSLNHKPHLQPIRDKLPFLQTFLEKNSQVSIQEVQDLEKKIKDVCHAAEDAIESHVLDQFLVKSGDIRKQNSLLFSEYLQKVMDDLDSMKETARMINVNSIQESSTRMMDLGRLPDKQPSESYTSGGSSKSAPGGDTNVIVGFDQHLINIMDRLTNHDPGLPILQISGMGGIGKTTLTRNVYDNENIKRHFEIRLWCTISQSFEVRDILLRFLHDLGSFYQTTDPIRDDELGDKLYKALYGRKYLIVLDDMWSVEAWERIKRYLPKDGDGNRIIVTTRLKSMASDWNLYKLGFLNEEESWRLLNDKVRLQNGDPLEDIGRKIAKSCGGLPLAIVVTGGHLANSNRTQESWDFIAKGLNSIVNSEDDEYCRNLLSPSYENLPVHLKPCFLFMGVFPEDSEVRVSTLVKLWVAEGFLKDVKTKCLEDSEVEYLNNDDLVKPKCLEDCAVEYLQDLVERNLVLVVTQGSGGNLKSIRIHDLFRDLCLKVAQNHDFLIFKRFHSLHNPRGLHILPGIKTKNSNGIYRTAELPMSHPVTLHPNRSASMKFSSLKLLRQLNVADVNSSDKNRLLIGSRCLTLSEHDTSTSLDSISMLWNLQSLTMRETLGDKPVALPPQIWKMPLIRHVEIPKLVLPNPEEAELISGSTHHILENMHTLEDVYNFNFSFELQRRVPNLKKLKLTYKKDTEDTEDAEDVVEWPFPESNCCIHLTQLLKLESLSCSLNIKISMADMSFPESLKQLTLDGGEIPWEDMSKVGQLPNLVVLRLHNDAFSGTDWTTAEGEFRKLKSLHLQNVCLENWETEWSHFPTLERLSFCNIWGLKDIREGFEESPTLEFMSFEFCSTSLVNSAEQIKEKQESFGNAGVQVQHQLTCNTKDELVVTLEYDLVKLRVILDNLISERKDKESRQIQHLIDDAQEIKDTYLTAERAKSSQKRWLRKTFQLAACFNNLYEITKKVEFQLQLNKSCSTNTHQDDEDPPNLGLNWMFPKLEGPPFCEFDEFL